MDIGLDVFRSYELIHGTGEQFQSHLYPGRHIAQLHQEAVDRAKKLTEVFQRVQSLSQIGLKFQGLTASTDLFAVIGGELEEFSFPCVIVLLSSDGTCLEVQYVSSAIGTMGWGILGPATKTLSISVGETVICRQVLETRTGRFVSDPGEVMAELLGSPTDPKCQSAFVAPLVTQDRAIGLLILGLDNEQLEDFPLLMAFANQVAATIGICQLHTELQQQLAEMQSVLVVTRALVSEVGLNNLLEFIMTQAEHLTNARGAAVLLLSDDGQWLEVATPGESWLRLKAGSRLPVNESLPGLAIGSQQVQICNHAQDDGRTVSVRALLQPTELHSLLCAPLVAQGKGLGVLLVWDKRKHPFTAHDSRLMSLFADQAALALDNAHLHAENRQLAVEQERRRLARELHDSVTQSIYSIAMAAQTSLKLLSQSGVNGKVRDPIEHILEFSRLALAEMRDLLNNLYPADLADKGLVEFLAQHCDMLRAQYSLAIGFTADQEPALSMPRRQALYCIAREALWNVIKHAVATRVDVSLTSEDDQVVLSIVDDGVGFDPSTLTREEAMGLTTMQERTQLLGGIFKLQSKSGQGTRVTARFPA